MLIAAIFFACLQTTLLRSPFRKWIIDFNVISSTLVFIVAIVLNLLLLLSYEVADRDESGNP